MITSVSATANGSVKLNRRDSGEVSPVGRDKESACRAEDGGANSERARSRAADADPGRDEAVDPAVVRRSPVRRVELPFGIGVIRCEWWRIGDVFVAVAMTTEEENSDVLFAEFVAVMET